MSDVRNKETICATVSPYLKKQVDTLVAAKEFSSMSDLVNIALTEFLKNYSSQKKTPGQKTELTKPVTL